MKFIKLGGLFILPALLLLDLPSAFAADEGLSGRQIWDKVMLFFNFGLDILGHNERNWNDPG